MGIWDEKPCDGLITFAARNGIASVRPKDGAIGIEDICTPKDCRTSAYVGYPTGGSDAGLVNFAQGEDS